MPNNVLIYIPFDSDLSYEPGLLKFITRYRDKYKGNCKIHYHGKKRSKGDDISVVDDISARNVATADGTILVMGHGHPHQFNLEITTAKGRVQLGYENIAQRMQEDGLDAGHKFVKSLSCCGAGLGNFDLERRVIASVQHGGRTPVRVTQIQVNCFARELAIQLGGGHQSIRVGGYPGYLDASLQQKLIQMLTTTVNPKKACVGFFTWGPKREAFNSMPEIHSSLRDNPNYKNHKNRNDFRLTMIPVHDPDKPFDRNDKLVEAIWFNSKGDRLVNKHGNETWKETIRLFEQELSELGNWVP